jgi:actin-related protein
MNEEDKNQKLLKKQLKSLTDKTEHLQKIMDKGKDTIVIRIGVKFTEFGFANSELPFIIPTNLISVTNWDASSKDTKNSGGTWQKLKKQIDQDQRELKSFDDMLLIGRYIFYFNICNSFQILYFMFFFKLMNVVLILRK